MQELDGFCVVACLVRPARLVQALVTPDGSDCERRTREEPGLEKSSSHEYIESGEFRIVVKVIDILGNDTTKTLSIEIP